MAAQPSLFDREEVGPVRRAAQVAVAPAAPVQPLPVGDRPEGWRAPTVGEMACRRCGGAACCGDKGQWFCWSCKPGDFLSLARTPAAQTDHGFLFGDGVARPTGILAHAPIAVAMVRR